MNIADYILVAGDNISPEHKEVRTFISGGLKSAGTPNGGKGISDATKLP